MKKNFSIEDLDNNEAMVTEALGLLQSIIAELKKHGICKLEITARVTQDKMVFGDPDCFWRQTGIAAPCPPGGN